MRFIHIKLVIASILLMITLNSCSDGFSVEYNEVIDSKNRTISIKTMNPELAPGDTAVIEMYFAGEEINPTYICSLALDIKTEVLGGNEVDANIVPIDKYRVVNPTYPDVTTKDYIRFSFVVPDSAFYYASGITEYPFRSLDDYISDQFPDEVKDMPKDEFIVYATDILENYDFAGADEQTALGGNVIAQMLTAKLRLRFEINGNKSQKSITTRLHKRVKNNEYVFPNRNTTINWVKLYTVKDNDEGKTYFDPKENDRSYSYVYFYADSNTLANDPTAIVDSVINVKNGYLYFLEADTGVAALQPNSNKDMYTSFAGYSAEEYWRTDWFFQQEAAQVVDVSLDEQANLGSGITTQVFVPKDKSITYIDTWCVTYDVVVGERFRPIGEEVFDKRLYFNW